MSNSKSLKVVRAPYPQPLPTCHFANQHGLGIFCPQCNAIAMPWGGRLPWAVDDLGLVIANPAKGAILEGLYLHPSGVVAVAFLAYCKVNEQYHGKFENVTRRLNEPNLQAIATRIVEVADFLEKVKTAQPRPKWYQILADALIEPNITIVQYIIKIAGGSEIKMMDNNANRSCETNDSNPDDTGDEERHRIGNRKGDQWETSASLTPIKPSLFLSDDEANWEFVQGSDIEDAILYRSDPSKFFLVRQKVGNPQQKDIFYYPQWDKFDWSNAENIHHLNEARHQIRARTKSHNIIESRSPTSPESASTLKSTPTLKLTSTPKSTATLQTTQKQKNMSPFLSPVPIRRKKRKLHEMVQSDHEGDPTMDEDAEVKEKDTTELRTPGARKKKCVRAGTRAGMASPISKSRSLKSICDAGPEEVPILRFNVAAPMAQSVSPESSGCNDRDMSFSHMQLSFF